MISPFNDRFQVLLLGGDEPSHVTLQQKPERRLPFENIAHERVIAARFEFVDVPQTREGSAHHLIDKASRAIDFNDLRRKSLADSEVAALERDEIAEL